MWKESIIESKAMRYLDSRCGSSSASSGVFSDRKVLGGKVSPHLSKSPAGLMFNNVALQPRGKWKYIIFISSFPLLPSSPAGNWREGIYLEIWLDLVLVNNSGLLCPDCGWWTASSSPGMETQSVDCSLPVCPQERCAWTVSVSRRSAELIIIFQNI